MPFRTQSSNSGRSPVVRPSSGLSIRRTVISAGAGAECSERVLEQQIGEQDCPRALVPLLDYLRQLAAPASLGTLESLLHRTRMRREDFGRFCRFGHRTYTRNIIARSKWFDLALLCWRPGQRSPIHDHRHSACAFRVIEGEGTETHYRLNPDKKTVTREECHIMPQGYICAAHDGDIHEVSNETDSDLITLHAYSPRLKMTTYPRPKIV